MRPYCLIYGPRCKRILLDNKSKSCAIYKKLFFVFFFWSKQRDIEKKMLKVHTYMYISK